MNQMSKYCRLIWLLVLIFGAYNLCESKIKECSGAIVKIEGDSLIVTIDKVKGKAPNEFLGQSYLAICRSEHRKDERDKDNHFVSFESDNLIKLKPSKKYEFNNISFRIHLDEFRRYCYDKSSNTYKKRSDWEPGKNNKLRVCLNLMEFELEGDYKKVFDDYVLIPCPVTKMSLGGVTATIEKGSVNVIFNDVLIENPDCKDFELIAWFMDKDGKLLKNTNNLYSTTDGYVCTYVRYMELCKTNNWTNRVLSIPLEELHLPNNTKNGTKIRIKATIVDKTTGTQAETKIL